ncbi:hypothetical protein [Candidatus Synchoanobacter obligatus]|uniref:Uncharacterized protein n=1 Tax=Candidatus Synchoanobacter obligatus TaxID=2919597 RepID=A0ABT1L746_9GAMM|nr:hypothetical protein [Candidatus Synchoanobacter obligatus]MCP8352606.1 hypothetical protein [Candidatus Synchoanobacter obligatus]
MNTQVTTHLHVLSVTYPELKMSLESLIGKPLLPSELELYASSYWYGGGVMSLAAAVQTYSSNYHRINLVLNRFNKIILCFDHLAYDKMSESQLHDAPELGSEIDSTIEHIRSDIYPKAHERYQVLVSEEGVALKAARAHVQNIMKELEQAISQVNDKFGLSADVKICQSMLLSQDVKDWVERNQQVDKKSLNMLMDNLSAADKFFQSLVAISVLAHLYESVSEGAVADVEKTARKAVKFIYKQSMQAVIFPAVEVPVGGYVEELEEINERACELEEILASYPSDQEESEHNDVEKGLHKILNSNKDAIFTEVDKGVKS